MEASRRQIAEQQFYEQDWLEAKLIDGTRERLISEGETESVTQMAILAVNASLSDPESENSRLHPELSLSLPEGVDYETARKAKRWWNYRTAYLDDLQPVYNDLDRDAGEDPWHFGLERSYKSYTEKFQHLQQENIESGQWLILGEPYYNKFYAELESNLRNPDNLLFHDLLQIERRLAVRGLVNTIEKVFDEHEQAQVPTEHVEGIAGFDERGVVSYWLDASTDHVALVYRAGLRLSPYQTPEGEEQTDYDVSLAEYMVMSDPAKSNIVALRLGTRNPVDMRLEEIVDLTKGISPDEKFSFA